MQYIELDGIPIKVIGACTDPDFFEFSKTL